MLRVFLNRRVLEEAMARHNLTRKELAYAVALSRSYFSRVMCGREEASAAVRQRLLKIFPEYSFDDLFKIKMDEEPKEEKDSRG